MADTNNTIKTTVVVDATQAQQQIIKLGSLASDSTKTLEERIAAKNKQVKLQEQLSKQTILNLEKQQKALKGVEGKEKELKKVTDTLNKERLKSTRLIENSTKQLNKLNASQSKAGKQTKGLAVRMKGLGVQMLGAAGVVGGFQAFASVLKGAFNVVVNFEKASSNLAAILGKNKTEITALTEQAKQLGSTTAFTASQVVDAQTELAKLGFNPEKIEASIEGILSLAAATGTDLARSAEIAASTLNIFNLDASESGRVADVLAKSTTISSLSMEKLATIMPTVGKTAQIAGVSLEKTAALAGTLTDRGLDASSAATSLRNIFQELSKKGITWNDAMKQINDSTDKNKTAMNLFGKRAAAAGVILSETGESVEDLTLKLQDSQGAAEDMAKTMLDNLAGDMTIAQSAWEGFILSLEDGDGIMSKVSRNFTQAFTSMLGTLTNLNNGIYAFSQNIKDAAGATEFQDKTTRYLNLRIRQGATEQERANIATAAATRLQQDLAKQKAKLAFAEKNGLLDEEAGARLRIELLEAQIKTANRYIPKKQEQNEKDAESNVIAEEKAKLTAGEISSAKRKAEQAEQLAKRAEELEAKKEERRRANIQKQIEATDAENARLEKEQEEQSAWEAAEEQRLAEKAAADQAREVEAQLSLDEALLEVKRANGENVLAEELSILERRKSQELNNEELTAKERHIINQKYALESTKLEEAAEKAKKAARMQGINDAIGGLGELFGFQKEAAVAQMLIAAPEAIGKAWKANAGLPFPLNIAATGASVAAIVPPIIKGLSDIKKTRFSAKGKSSGGSGGSGGSVSTSGGGGARPIAPTEITDIAANNSARLGVDPSIASNAGGDAANNVLGEAKSEVVFSESRYSDFNNQVQFKEGKVTV